MGPVGNHLVDIHIGLGSGAGLPDLQGKFPGQFPLNDFVANPADGLCFLRRQPPQRTIGHGRRFFDNSKGPDDLFGHGLPADFKIFQGPLGLCPPIGIPRNPDLPHGVCFNACLHLKPPGIYIMPGVQSSAYISPWPASPFFEQEAYHD